MHAMAGIHARARPYFAFAVILLMVLSAVLVPTMPAKGVIVEDLAEGELPVEWNLPEDGSATFNVSLPGGGLVREATLALEGACTTAYIDLSHGADEWGALPPGAVDGFVIDGDALEPLSENLAVRVGPDELGNYEEAIDLVVGQRVSLATTSPTFSNDGGGQWSHYIEMDVALDEGQPKKNVVAYIYLDIPPGHCSDVRELRLADPKLKEVPYQMVDWTKDPGDDSVVHARFLCRVDMPATGAVPYRLYYGNPDATSPAYKPLLIWGEAWDYNGLLDPNFLAEWRPLPWSGSNGAGRSHANLRDVGGANQFDQSIDVNPAFTYSQVWTSSNSRHTDALLQTFVSDFSSDVSRGSTGMWGLDFRTSGTDCYRLVYTDTRENNTESRISLYRVGSTRHLESEQLPMDKWRLLTEKPLTLNATQRYQVVIRAKGDDIRVWIGDDTNPILAVRDGSLTTGVVGTFLGGMNPGFAGTTIKVGASFGPMYLWDADINLSSRNVQFFPGPERTQHVASGSYLSVPYELPGARDAIVSIDVMLPPGTSYSANLLSPSGDVLRADVRDGDAVPEGFLEGGFKLHMKLSTLWDHVTPHLRGWGVGYMADVHPPSDRTPESADDVVVHKDAYALAPSREVWAKDQNPSMKAGNIPEDQGGIRVGSMIRYGDTQRLYYTGISSSGQQSICMALTHDGREFFGHRQVLSNPMMSIRWDSQRSDPTVIQYQTIWILYYIGWYRGVGQVGLAISSNGIDWISMPNPVLSPSSSGFDGYSIEDCSVIFDSDLYRFHMYYTAKSSSTSSRLSIGYASSPDGATWSRHASNPVISPGGQGSEWDTSYVRQPYAFRTRDQVVVYYLGGKGSDPYSDLSAIGVAVSDNGVDFKKIPGNPVLEPRKKGLADDYFGITGAIVQEAHAGQHYMLYSARGIDGVHKFFVAESGFAKEGWLVTKPFILPRAPRALGPLHVDIDVPLGSEVAYWLGILEGGSDEPSWYQLQPDELPPVPASAQFQLRFNLSSDAGDVTPVLFGASLSYMSNVHNGTLTAFPVATLDGPLMEISAELEGESTAGVEVQFRMSGMGAYEALFTGHGRYGTGPDFDFGYRMMAAFPPGDGPSLTRVRFSLGYESFASDVALDLGDDGTPDHTFKVARFEGLHEVSLTRETQSWYERQDQGDSVLLTVRVSTVTPGRITLVGVHFDVDLPVEIVSRSPVEEEVWIDEGASQVFSVTPEEPDGDPIVYAWFVDDDEVADTETYTHATEEDEDTDDPPPVTVKVTVSDGNSSRTITWEVHVRDTTVMPNVPPNIQSASPDSSLVTMDENASTTFHVTAIDPDLGPQALVFRWYVNDTLKNEGSDVTSFEFKADYESAGTYDVRVEAFDGLVGVNHSWALTVRNVLPPQPPNGNGDGRDDEGFEMLPLLLLLIILAIVAAGATVYMRGRRAAGAAAGPEPAPMEEPVTAEVPVGGEPTGEAFTETLGRDVAAGGPPDAAKVAPAVAPLAMPLMDMDKDRTFVVEEVYVIYNDGRLMCHRTRAERPTVDMDLFGGMFTAIQQFIHDSMGGAEVGTQVGRLDYGENRILVERGNYVFLAAIIFGEENEALRGAMRDVLNRIEGAYAGVIERWSGDQGQLSGVATFVSPLIGLTQDLSREDIMSRTRTEGVKLLSEVEFFQGFVRLKVAVRNDTKMVITNVATDIVFDSNVLRLDRIQPEYPISGSKVSIGTIAPREKKTVAYYLDPLICQESDIDGTATFKDAEGSFGAVTMKRRRADIVCPIFFTEENANTAMLKRLIHEELREQDSKLFTIPKMLPAIDAFELVKEVIRSHDVRFVREFVESEEGAPFHGEAWFYGVTKVKRDRMVIRASVLEERNTVEFFVASGRIEAITGLLAELGQNLNRTLKDKYLGRVKATLVVDRAAQEEVKGLGLLIDKYSEGEMAAGEVDQL